MIRTWFKNEGVAVLGGFESLECAWQKDFAQVYRNLSD